jgi:hypothetical protein
MDVLGFTDRYGNSFTINPSFLAAWGRIASSTTHSVWYQISSNVTEILATTAEEADAIKAAIDAAVEALP